MLAEVLPEWLGDTADAVGRAFDQVQAAPASGRKAGVLLFLTGELRRAVRALRAEIRREIAAGVEAQAFAAEYGPVADSLDLLAEKVRLLAAEISAKAEKRLARKLASRLGRIEDDIAETRNYLAKFLRAAAAPFPPLDEDGLRRGREDAAAGRTEDVRDIIGRLRSGEEV